MSWKRLPIVSCARRARARRLWAQKAGWAHRSAVISERDRQRHRRLYAARPARTRAELDRVLTDAVHTQLIDVMARRREEFWND
jgi:hypothetical protein